MVFARWISALFILATSNAPQVYSFSSTSSPRGVACASHSRRTFVKSFSRHQNRGITLSAALLDTSSVQSFKGPDGRLSGGSEMGMKDRSDDKSAKSGALYASGTAPNPATVDARIVRLALPAMCGALIDPLQSLVDTAWVGRLGAAPLAALGPCCEIFTFSFSVCWALREAATSLVGNALAKRDGAEAADVVDASLTMALVLGSALAWTIHTHAGLLIGVMGVPYGSPLYGPALAYLQVRALACPAVATLTVCEGACRGAGDLRTPVMVGLFAGVLNAVLDPLLMFPGGWPSTGVGAMSGCLSFVPAAMAGLAQHLPSQGGYGMAGAAMATLLAQYTAAGIGLFRVMLRANHHRAADVSLSSSFSGMAPDATSSGGGSDASGTGGAAAAKNNGMVGIPTDTLKTLKLKASRFGTTVAAVGGASSAMLVRTTSILAYWALATALATRLSAAAVAAHHVTLQVWMLFCMPGEAPAVAGQVLLPGALDHDARTQPRKTEPSSTEEVLPEGFEAAATAAPAPVAVTPTPASRRESSYQASRLLLFRTLRYSYGFGAILGGVLLFLAAPVLPAIFALDSAATASLVPLLPLAAWLMPLVCGNMALEAALVGAKRFRFLAQSTVLSTGFTSAGLLWASQQPGFSVEIIWRSVGGLFLLRSFTAAVELGRALSFYGKPPAATAA